jgi:tetratricopeptide (TPR) repeat protein
MVGDVRAAEIGAAHDQLVHRLLAQFDGMEYGRTDGYLIGFERPLAAVQFVLDYHHGLTQLSSQLEFPLRARAGIHQGELILRENAPDAIARGAKPAEAEGLAISIAARLMSLAGGGQTLLTRGAFDLARRAAVGNEALPPEIQWLAHGPYLFRGMDEPTEVFEVGQPGTSPLTPPLPSEKATRALRPGEEELLGWRPAPGGSIPGRDRWILERKLGEGGFGEAWLARYTKTREPRVFKFCFDPDRLRGLKREVTLFRVLKETLGKRDDIATILEWNFDGPPYFIESEYTDGGDLKDWVQSTDAQDAPLELRLLLVAEIAGAMAAAHSVGVLHKDIKPSNVLIFTGPDGQPHSRLADFGIGLVLDRALLGVAGVTETGLTDASILANHSSRTGTRLYTAPELIEGKPPTIQSDIYALGVVLYQLVVGDANRSLTGDWRDDIADELLREDIAACVAGDPARRLSSAAQLAERLTSLDARRSQRETRRREQEQIEATKRALESARARRKVLTLVSVMATGVIFALSFLYVRAESEKARAESAAIEAQKQRDTAQRAEEKASAAAARARTARAQAEEVIQFTLVDLSAKLKDRGQLPLLAPITSRTLEYYRAVDLDEEGMTTAAASRAVRSRIDVADVLSSLGNTSGALTTLNEAHAIADQLAQKDPDNAQWQRDLSVSWEKIGNIRQAQGDLTAALDAFTQSKTIRDRLTQRDPNNTEWQRDLSGSLNNIGLIRRAQGDLTAALDAHTKSKTIADRLAQRDPDNTEWQRDLSRSWNNIGNTRQDQGALTAALDAHTQAKTIDDRLTQRDPDNTAWQRDLSGSLNNIGAIRQAQGDLTAALEAYTQSKTINDRLTQRDPDNTAWQRDLSSRWNNIGIIRQAQGDLTAALDAYTQQITIIKRLAKRDPGNSEWQSDLARSYQNLGDIHVVEGNLKAALVNFEEARKTLARVIETDSTNLFARHSIAIIYQHIGKAEMDLGNPHQALIIYENFLNIAKELRDKDPSNDSYQNTLSIAYIKLGDVQVTLGNLDSAKEAYMESIEMTRTLLAKNSNNRDNNILSWNIDSLGIIHLKSKNYQAAVDSFKESLEIRGRLRSESPTNTNWERSIAVSYYRLGTVYEEMSSATLTIENYSKAIDTLERMRLRGIKISAVDESRLRDMKSKIESLQQQTK